MSRGSSLSGPGLAARAIFAFRGGLVMLGVIVFVASAAVTAWPRFADALLTSDLHYRVEQAGPVNTDLITSVGVTDFYAYGPDRAASLWRAMPGTLAAARAAMKPDLRSVTTAGDFTSRGSRLSLGPPADAEPLSRYAVQLEGYERLRETADLDSGTWPAASTVASAAPIQIVMSTPVAALFDWKVGQVRSVALGETEQPIILVGTVHPRDASDDFWQLDRLRGDGLFADRGDQGKEYAAVVWVDPDSWPAMTSSFLPVTTVGWFGMKPNAFAAGSLAAVQAQLDHFLANPIRAQAGDPVSLRFATSLNAALDAFLARAEPANTLFAILVAGPIGVALAVLVLGVRLALGRRREALALMASRGASPLRLRSGLAVEGAIVSVPAAAFGIVVAFALTPGSELVGPPLAFGALCALAPPVILAIVAGALGPRDDVGAERSARRRWGWVVEVIVVGLAALAVVALFQRGLTPPNAGLSVDPLLAVTPILVALAACIVVLRLYPIPLAWLAGALRRRRGAVAYIGVTSSMRSRAGGLWPVFAVVVGVSITVFSVSVLSTERGGIMEGARSRVGADLSVTAGSLSAAQIARVKAIPGVAHTAVVYWAGGVIVNHSGQSDLISGYLVDPHELAPVEASLPASARISAALEHPPFGRTAAVVGGWTSTVPVTSAVLVAGTNLHLDVRSFDYKPGVYLWDAQWIFLDKTALTPRAGITGTPSTVLIALKPGADSAAVHAALVSIGGKGATIGDAASEAKVLRAAPLISGLELIALASIVLSALMCVGALLLTLVMNAAARTRLVATLRTIGFTSRQAGGLIGWELGPIVVAGLIAGLAVGLALPAIVLAPIDLSGFTGGPTAPAVTIDPVLLALGVAGFVAITVVATLVALVGARLRSPATVLRAGGE
ncbi:ABC transporter permease [Diaminobutyricibacter sp. McL0608]|uniref:ABC transporter permease n=1 Tax=Leifsonia sp. McL0608 TaxID=3143537 RepID=UPI0031F33271